MKNMDKTYKSFGELYNNLGMPKKMRTVTKWQDEASNAVSFFIDGQKFTGSIFKSFRDNNHLAKLAFSDCKELNKPNALYFLKIYSELVKLEKSKISNPKI